MTFEDALSRGRATDVNDHDLCKALQEDNSFTSRQLRGITFYEQTDNVFVVECHKGLSDGLLHKLIYLRTAEEWYR